MKYLFVLGNCPQLAKAEIESVLTRFHIPFSGGIFAANFFILDLTQPIEAKTLSQLGGTVKAALIFTGPIAEELSSNRQPGERINFGLSGEDFVSRSKILKRSLEERGFKARFVLPSKGAKELSSVVVKKKKLTEIYSVRVNGENYTARTIFVQDFEDWGKRDCGRPAVHAHVGMLPPKLARMMVNIALPVTGNRQPAAILDPFCGVGTILAEALLLGQKVIGSDINHQQIGRTQKNLDWLCAVYSNLEKEDYKLFVSDARDIGTKLDFQKVSAIVTEPDLGPTDMDRKNYPLPKIIEKLTGLYSDCLQTWKKIIIPEGKIVIVLPSFADPALKTPVNAQIVKTIIDKTKLMGYSLVLGPIEYFRPQAIVRRDICVFVKE